MFWYLINIPEKHSAFFLITFPLFARHAEAWSHQLSSIFIIQEKFYNKEVSNKKL